MKREVSGRDEASSERNGVKEQWGKPGLLALSMRVCASAEFIARNATVRLTCDLRGNGAVSREPLQRRR